MASCDPSLITLIESHGHIPRRRKVAEIGAVLGDVNKALVEAGYLPHVLSKLVDPNADLVKRLSPNVQEMVAELATLRREDQDRYTETLRMALRVRAR